MDTRILVTACTASMALTLGASAQSFNVDSDTAVAGAAGIGAPSAAFGGAANQPGTWNAISGNTVLSIPLMNLDGSPSAVTFTRAAAAGGNFAFQNAASTGDFELLMDDGYDFSAAPTGFVAYSFVGLQNGTYEVYSYALAPDFPPDITAVRVGTDVGTQQTCGGAMPANAFVLGTTHVIHTVTVTNGTLEMQADGLTAADFGTLNGVQIKLLPGIDCPSDINNDTVVDVTDLLAVITSWGACAPPCPPSCAADIAPAGGNCIVDVSDLLAVITSWGPCK